MRDAGAECDGADGVALDEFGRDVTGAVGVDVITRALELTSPVRSRATLASASASEFNSRGICSMAK